MLPSLSPWRTRIILFGRSLVWSVVVVVVVVTPCFIIFCLDRHMGWDRSLE
ncbi:hypothetical protein Hanom_Chr09g00812331 [Helianthus anomalus]